MPEERSREQIRVDAFLIEWEMRSRMMRSSKLFTVAQIEDHRQEIMCRYLVTEEEIRKREEES